MRYIHLRLTQRPCERLHGLDLSRARVGDIVVVTERSAIRLIAEGCAVEVHDRQGDRMEAYDRRGSETGKQQT